ncbi:SAP domain-containing protein [Trichloromonas sp.]|uniref:SAP domain-containing protein n=1 Tax=Trichloromonas sp. TaxID=3069249 RepID=UPI003D817CA6
MKMEEIKAVARVRGVKSGRMKKAELVRAIQQAEGNNQCFVTGQADRCGQYECLWREDCD